MSRPVASIAIVPFNLSLNAKQIGAERLWGLFGIGFSLKVKESGAVAQESRFAPQAAESVVKFIRAVH
jgi:hypothetical protein